MFWPEDPCPLLLGQTHHHSDEIGCIQGGMTVDSHSPSLPTTTILELEEDEKDSVGGVSGSEERLSLRAQAKVEGSS